MKRINKFILALLFVFSAIQVYSHSNAIECPIVALANDISTSGIEFKSLIKSPEIFKAWNLLNKETPTLRTNIEELKLVSNNLNEINNAGGYLKWKVIIAISRLENPLKLSCNAVLGTGGTVIEDGNFLKLFSKNGDEIASINNGKILPKKYAEYPLNPSATSIGQSSNGYQIFKYGDDLMVRRMPDKSAYNASELNELTQHPRAHVLERHGHDVPDEALTKRSQTPSIAPDGDFRTNPPLFSSKFESSGKLKEALNNTKPGSSNFNPPSNGDTYAFDYPLSGQASSPFGYGIPAGGGNSVQMYRVKVVYKKHGGAWKLFTMYPQL